MSSHQRRFAVAVLVSLFVCACSSSDSSMSKAVAPEVSVEQLTSVPRLRNRVAGGLPVDYRVSIVNNGGHEVTLRSIEMESIGDSGAYAMRRVRHAFNRKIAARASDEIEIRAWVQPLQGDELGQTSNRVNIRGWARFDGPDGVLRRNFVARAQ